MTAGFVEEVDCGGGEEREDCEARGIRRQGRRHGGYFLKGALICPMLHLSASMAANVFEKKKTLSFELPFFFLDE